MLRAHEESRMRRVQWCQRMLFVCPKCPGVSQVTSGRRSWGYGYPFRNYVTHYGQVCCYDRDGYLMQTSYQTVVQMNNYPYSPGFPQRAYEFGTYPYTKQFEVCGMWH